MTQLVAYHPSLPFHNAFDNLLNDAFIRPTLRDRNHSLAVDVQDKPDRYVLQANLPGLTAEEVKIEIQNNGIVIGVETDGDKNGESGKFLIRERSLRRYYRKLRLPSTLDPKKADAEIENGVLTITLPKADTERPNLLPVRMK